jgi:hypothetical protein
VEVKKMAYKFIARQKGQVTAESKLYKTKRDVISASNRAKKAIGKGVSIRIVNV